MSTASSALVNEECSRTNDKSLLAALRELGDCLSAVDVPQGVIETFPSLSDLQTQLFTTVFVQELASGTADLISHLQPTDLLLKMLAAARAGDWPRFLVLVHNATASSLLELAQLVAKVASTAEPNQEYCTSFLIPRAYLEGEVVETLEVVWGTRRTTVCGELVRIDVNIDHSSTGTLDVCQILRFYVAPLIESFGGVLQNTPEGLVILSGNHSAIEADRHVTPPKRNESTPASPE